MDPPSYGRGRRAKSGSWRKKSTGFWTSARGFLSENPLFVALNSYTTGLSPSVMAYLLGVTVGKGRKGTVSADEIGLPVQQSGLTLPCGLHRFLDERGDKQVSVLQSNGVGADSISAR